MGLSRINHRLSQTDALIRLAALRRDIALRGLARARTALADAVTARDTARAQADRLAQAQAERRQVLRDPLLGSAQLRGALDGVLNTFTADRTREAQAEQAVTDATHQIETARAALETARGVLAGAERVLDKRKRLRQPLAEARNRALEQAAEAETAEFRPQTAPSPDHRGQP